MTEKEFVETCSDYLAENQANGVDMDGRSFVFVVREDETIEEYRGEAGTVLANLLRDDLRGLFEPLKNRVVRLAACVRREQDGYWVVSLIPNFPIPVWNSTIYPPLPEGGFDPEIGIPGEALLQEAGKHA
jgi:hypothetical protein